MKKNNKKYALKEMSKVRIIDRHSEKSIKSERNFLSVLLHPFIVNMVCSFQDYENLYLVMDLLTGGDLRYHLCKLLHFTEEETKFFTACLILGLEYIHGNNIIHRDIKPENLVSDENGYIRITDFGVAKIKKEDNSSETSGTPGYMAPEVLLGLNHSFPVDFFAIGVMGYEFMNGERPYIGKNRKDIKHLMLKKQAKIEKGRIPVGWSLESVDFINKCLKRKESRRLGYKNGISELKNHEWFKDFDWESLYNKTMQAPFIPKKAGNYDKKYCDFVEKISDTTLERYQDYLNKKNFKNVFDGYTCINIEMFQNNNNVIETTSINQTGTKSNKISGKTNSSTGVDVVNKIQLNYTGELTNKTFKNKINNRDKDKEISNVKNKDKDKEKIDALNQLNCLSLSDKEKEFKIKLKDKKSNLSLQQFLNCSNQKRIKFGGLNKNIMRQNNKKKDIINKEKGKLSNLSDLDPSLINNFKKVEMKLEEKNKKLRSSSVCYSYNNNAHNESNSKLNNTKNALSSNGAKTIDTNKINPLFNLVNLDHKEPITRKNFDKIKQSKKLNIQENFSKFKTPMGSPKNLNKGKLIYQNELININKGYKTNRLAHLFLPNLLRERTLSPTFRNGMKIKDKMHINIDILHQIKMKLYIKKEKHDKDYKKMMNNKKYYKTGNISLNKKADNTSLFNRFIYSNKKMKTRDVSSKSHKNICANKSNLTDREYNNNMYATLKVEKLKHNFSALNI